MAAEPESLDDYINEAFEWAVDEALPFVSLPAGYESRLRCAIEDFFVEMPDDEFLKVVEHMGFRKFEGDR